jgi:hypothetical protein
MRRNLFNGFLITEPQFPGWWIWYHYLDPLTFTCVPATLVALCCAPTLHARAQVICCKNLHTPTLVRDPSMPRRSVLCCTVQLLPTLVPEHVVALLVAAWLRYNA